MIARKTVKRKSHPSSFSFGILDLQLYFSLFLEKIKSFFIYLRFVDVFANTLLLNDLL